MAVAIKPLASLGSVGKSTAVSATVAAEKRSATKQFSAAANDILQKPSLRVAPRTVQMQKGAIQDKGTPRNSGAKPFSPQTLIGSFKKGGRVKKTGVYKLHKGEHVLNVDQTKAADDRVQMESPMSRILGKEN